MVSWARLDYQKHTIVILSEANAESKDVEDVPDLNVDSSIYQ
jgi:hypothetical protein